MTPALALTLGAQDDNNIEVNAFQCLLHYKELAAPLGAKGSKSPNPPM